ncbi:methyltransferase family protein [Neorhodopirellula pilleata]|uniref:Isoprenylcysteine carboxyl methyltransferase (ICMT) family protein n=1 Tax=Neorhodopirellula pilleata TaxID=2714738 RepID=A0A5C6A1C1_9BACT|nr:methyltransferase [Neorhodopirellula pilleata]TWT93110.1 Isoprenylcysteine carboxyl methyltransferase (ICMT) family protein [Neorhodopirellula pilleata]
MYHTFLITAQFGLSAWLILSADWMPLPFLAMTLAAPGIGLAIWAWFTMGWRRLRIHPTTSSRTRLTTRGPYAIVRHPMYTGLLWLTAALMPIPLTWWRLAAWVILLAVLVAKTREEEIAMIKRFPEYATYREQVGGLFPKFPGKSTR